MDGSPSSISSRDLYARLGTASAPVLVDVRRDDAFNADDRQIVGAVHHSPQDVERWASASTPGQLKHGMVIYDALYSWCRSQRPRN